MLDEKDETADAPLPGLIVLRFRPNNAANFRQVILFGNAGKGCIVDGYQETHWFTVSPKLGTGPVHDQTYSFGGYGSLKYIDNASSTGNIIFGGARYTRTFSFKRRTILNDTLDPYEPYEPYEVESDELSA